MSLAPAPASAPPVAVHLALEHDVAVLLEQLAARAKVTPSALVGRMVRDASAASQASTLVEGLARALATTDPRSRL